MHGLNTHQTMDFTVHQQNMDAGQSTNAFSFSYSPDAPSLLPFAIPTFSGTGDTQHYIKRLYLTATYTNTGHFPIFVQTIWLRARNDITIANNLTTLMQDDAPP